MSARDTQSVTQGRWLRSDSSDWIEASYAAPAARIG
jgi:hypothetical protein